MVRTLRGISCPILILIFLTSSGMVSTVFADDWWERVSLKGDFRFRHEMIDVEGKDARHRQRIRARLSVAGDLAPGIGVGVQLATGSSDPTSTNQTLDNAGSTKSIGLNLAYAKASHEKVPGITLSVGKMKNPFHRPGGGELIWDGDWNPEGGSLELLRTINQTKFELTGAAFWLDERSSSDDAWLGAAQGVFTLNFNGNRSSVRIGGSYFDFVNTIYFTPLYDPEEPMGNSVIEVDEDGETTLYYSQKYELVELFAEAAHKVGEVPVALFGDFVTNTSVDSLEMGWMVGFSAGKLKRPGDWRIAYSYRDLEKDAVVGTLTDSDFGGGGTDARGHEFGGGVQVFENTTLSLSYFLNERGLQGTANDYSRLQLDAQFKF